MHEAKQVLKDVDRYACLDALNDGGREARSGPFKPFTFPLILHRECVPAKVRSSGWREGVQVDA